MHEKKDLVVGGFQFVTAKDATAARKEVQKIEVIESRIDYSSPEKVFALYESAIQNRVFETPVGYSYLHMLREYLLEHSIEGKEVSSIPLFINYSQSMRESTQPARKRIEPEVKKERTLDKLKTSVTINVLLIIMVIAMFFITLTSKNPNILNYENAIVNKYASWEQELTKRETAVKEKERELNLSE